MPYTMVRKWDNDRNYVSTTFVQYNGWQAEYSLQLGQDYKPLSGHVNYTRSGTNNNVPFNSLTCKKRPSKWLIPPRKMLVPIKPTRWVWSFKRKKWVLLRKTIYYKYIWTKGVLAKKRKRPPKLINARVNALNYSSSKISFAGNNVVIDFAKNNGSGDINHYYFYGNLWRNAFRLSNYVVSVNSVPNPQTYLEDLHFRDSSVESTVDAAALSKLYSKAKNQSVNLLQMFAERKQTMSMFVELATRVAKCLIQFKAGRLAAAIKTIVGGTPKSVANDVLMLRYGLQPLLSDIDGIAKELATSEPIEFTIKGRKKHNYPAKIEEFPFYNPQGIMGKVIVTTEASYECVYVTRVRAVPLARDISRLGFGNLNSVAWEVIPWSFVVDWFIPIGNYLNNLDAYASLEVLDSYKTVVRKTTTTYMTHFGGSADGNTTSSGVSGFVNESFQCVRTISNVVPELGFPSFKDPRSTEHWQNALALFVQLKK